MNTIIKKSIITLFSLSLLFSCTNDFLELDPSFALKEKDVFSKYSSAHSALVGAYDQLSSPNFDGLYNPIMSDIMGEDVMINSEDNWNWFTDVYQMNLLPTFTYINSPWWIGYKIIFDTNKIIENVNNIPDATQEQKDNIEGQARALRAYVNLKLVQMYAPAHKRNSMAPSIMIVDQVLDVEAEDPGRSPLQDAYDLIESDLLKAVELLPDLEPLDIDEGFISKKGAHALLARTYLDQEKWEEAKVNAQNAYKDLDLMTANEMYGGFMSRNSETIFTIAYTEEDNNVYLSLPSFYWPVGGYSSMRANDKFIEKFSTEDLRFFFFLKEEEIDENRNLILKFGHNRIVGNAERIVIRASEMYLIEAECEAELGNYSKAQDALHVIQSRAYPGVPKSKNVGQELIDEVLLERRKELFGEGFRWNDIKRRQLPFVREGDHWVKFNFTANDNDYYRLTFPIPQSEIDANTNISEADQNIGY
ncbi:RagB/SusD family nutrient uptake outer membrane protein [Flammeovirga sp. EKP202]|uniref:RagB/SusD family nutrient uptake outer membrane protein n=1 Tax=Flammeovirga sp. EKP202 TaxID=2770592 RepID=UPI00165F0B2C|nr:RagB/SusD family nutrient uptake outer membrane protein [Flammeovirga sp. EKP202]MBD0402194.1 RagB/SusD family nutrient uptake outer membrane protein [Flammeovirga sp. EKP202]